jgi:beta-N-acetylhexosaminidase
MLTSLRIFWILLLFISINATAQPANNSVKLPKPKGNMQTWVDSVFNSLTLDQKLGQLFMIAAYSGGEKYNKPVIEKLISQNFIGGLIFMQGTAEAQAEQTNEFQKASKVPLLIGMDAEWGLGMRLKGVDDFPRQIMLGAMKDTTLVYKMAQAIAYQCRRLGVHMDFAPVVDINNNPNNPVINFRSFGENKFNVSNYGTQYVKGLQENGVIASAKHFPGHGNTDVDSHKDLPTISSSEKSLMDLELYPFRQMINNMVGSIMIAHLQIPALDNTPNTPTTLSYKVVTELLKEKMGYKGLIITDALNMEGVAKYFAPGEVDVKAFKAGNDILLFSQNVNTAVQKLKEAINNGTISEERIEESVKKILTAKYFVGLNKSKNISAENITKDLNQYTNSIRTQVAKEAITLLTDQNNVLDKIRRNGAKKVAYVGIGGTANNTFIKALNAYGITESYFVNGDKLQAKLKDYDAIIIGIHNVALYPGKNFGLQVSDVETANELLKNKNAMLVLFGNPYAMKYFCNAKAALVGYDEKPETQIVMADIIGGKIRAKGKLPVSVCPSFAAGSGIASITNELGEKNKSNQEANRELKDVKFTATDDRIIHLHHEDSTMHRKFDLVPSIKNIAVPVNLNCCVNPASIGADNSKLDKIDALIDNAIARGAFPGCRILIAKEGKVFYDKSFGYSNYDKNQKVTDNTIYDLASVTKVLATTLAVMKLYEQEKLDLNKTLGDYLPMTKYTDKAYLKIKDVLLHQAGLKSWIPFYKETLDSNKQQRADIYNYIAKGDYTIQVAKNLYMNKHWVDTMWSRILMSPLGAKTYEYSDLDFIFLQKVVEKITGQSLEAYVTKEFYIPLGMKSTCFNPIKKGKPLSLIAPTENDKYFRYQVVQGNVHDMAAAMFGGISGHAGLFSTAGDVSIALQMLLNEGIYDGKRFFSRKTIQEFTSYKNATRRGLGWDKTEPNSNKSNPTADNCSLLTFGHTGFTGTCIWADPTYNLQFIFLSNRTYPSADNKLITNMDIRTKAQQYVYESLGIASRK